MKANFLPLALLAGMAAAQGGVDGVPKCGQPCVTEFTVGNSIAGCSQLDIACVCSNKDFLSNVACCLKDNCDEADQEAAVKYAKQICSGYDVEVPDKVECTTGAAATATPTANTGSTGVATETAPATTTKADEGDASQSEDASGSGSAPTSTGAAAPGPAGAGGLLGAAIAMLAAL